jgi:hypothetical protein
MPVATIDPNKSERFELKTAPADPNDPTDENGFVVLRALPYGMKLTRRDKATRMMMKQQPTNSGKRRGSASPSPDSTIELESMNEWAVAFDFSNCILDHNLTDQNKQKLNFSNSMAIKTLDPKVGSEIEKLINNLNEDEDELMLDDFPPQLSPLSTDEGKASQEDGNDLSTEKMETLKEA